MGNSYSVTREEQEEEEFRRLVEAVEIAQQRSTRHDDPEAGLHSPHRRTAAHRSDNSHLASADPIAPLEAIRSAWRPVPDPSQTVPPISQQQPVPCFANALHDQGPVVTTVPSDHFRPSILVPAAQIPQVIPVPEMIQYQRSQEAVKQWVSTVDAVESGEVRSPTPSISGSVKSFPLTWPESIRSPSPKMVHNEPSGTQYSAASDMMLHDDMGLGTRESFYDAHRDFDERRPPVRSPSRGRFPRRGRSTSIPRSYRRHSPQLLPSARVLVVVPPVQVEVPVQVPDVENRLASSDHSSCNSPIVSAQPFVTVFIPSDSRSRSRSRSRSQSPTRRRGPPSPRRTHGRSVEIPSSRRCISDSESQVVREQRDRPGSRYRSRSRPRSPHSIVRIGVSVENLREYPARTRSSSRSPSQCGSRRLKSRSTCSQSMSTTPEVVCVRPQPRPASPPPPVLICPPPPPEHRPTIVIRPPRSPSTTQRSRSPRPIIIQPPAWSPITAPCIRPPSLMSPPPEHRPPVIIQCPPSPERRSDTPASTREFERLLHLHERTLADYERRSQIWHEQSMQFARVLQRLEKHLILRDGPGKYPLAGLSPPPPWRGEDDYAIDDEYEGKEDKYAGVHIQELQYASPLTAKPFPSRPHAVGLSAVKSCSDDWRPAWNVFPLKAFRGSSYTYLKIRADWDDADLLKELSRSYDKLRTIWRKWFSLRSVRSITMVYADHTCVYPRRLGPAGISPSKNMRLRYFLRHPEQMRGRYEFMQVLTARTELGIEFMEGWQLTRIAIAILLPVLASLVLGVMYSIFVGDVSDAFTIAGYMTSAYSVCLVLLGLLNFVEF